MFCGDGGSAADAQHLATELLIPLRGSVPRSSLPALALTLDPAALTAGGNDFGFDKVFERPLRGLGQPGDVLSMMAKAVDRPGRPPRPSFRHC
jgi:D-sedoheptulose 7-phosphate isomerase